MIMEIRYLHKTGENSWTQKHLRMIQCTDVIVNHIDMPGDFHCDVNTLEKKGRTIQLKKEDGIAYEVYLENDNGKTIRKIYG